jgi:hypothetical membrane protein
VLNAAGIAAPVIWVMALVYVGSLRPEYSHSRQYISELAARGTPTQHLMQVVGFLLPGAWWLGSACSLVFPLRRSVEALARHC